MEQGYRNYGRRERDMPYDIRLAGRHRRPDHTTIGRSGSICLRAKIFRRRQGCSSWKRAKYVELDLTPGTLGEDQRPPVRMYLRRWARAVCSPRAGEFIRQAY